ncbi:ATP12 family chaperone protein [Shimia sp.]|uniref:ATP12 family chaperone protein n=1 Tax=Shimia sp. TaxID=1954381 RepID=UPI0035618680
MSGWARKRFWKEAWAEQEGDSWLVKLDGRAVKTPAKAPLALPTPGLAEAVVAEWQAQEGELDPLSMPVTRSANAAIDKVAHQHGEVAEMIADYGGSDLLCYRATQPEALIARQAEAWDPLLDWAAETLKARLHPVSGVMFAPQDEAALKNLRQRVHDLTNFELAAFHDLVGLSGSLVLGFAAVHGHLPVADLWRLSRLDEDWQAEQWGADEEAEAQAKAKQEAFFHADRFFRMSRK